MFDILLYLFENYIHDEVDEEMKETDIEQLHQELITAGFSEDEIDSAFTWLEGLENPPPTNLNEKEGAAVTSFRHYSDEELEVLGAESRGFLLFLEQMGVLGHNSREKVIDRILALGGEEVDLQQLKWVILMVLFNQPGHEASAIWMEDIVMDEETVSLH
ncbi:MAG: DUF494 domain-containing protein [Gammaproteobacteria bacterium]|nr:DUF494 domain-containing protein [Gammaproteobacteria bacterium]